MAGINLVFGSDMSGKMLVDAGAIDKARKSQSPKSLEFRVDKDVRRQDNGLKLQGSLINHGSKVERVICHKTACVAPLELRA
jgi:hypothetical protein